MSEPRRLDSGVRHALLIQMDAAVASERRGDLLSVQKTLASMRRKAENDPEHARNDAVILAIRFMELVEDRMLHAMSKTPDGF